jgi:hypothetical protein
LIGGSVDVVVVIVDVTTFDVGREDEEEEAEEDEPRGMILNRVGPERLISRTIFNSVLPFSFGSREMLDG